MSVRVRSAPPPPRAIDSTEAEQARARKLWTGRAGSEASEDDVIRAILNTEFSTVKPELRGAYRSEAKATLAWLGWTGVLLLVEHGRYRWADEFPEWPKRTHAEIQARDADLVRQEHEAALRRVDEARAEEWQRHDPRDRELEQRIAALEDGLAGLRLEIRSLARRRDGDRTVARLDEIAARTAANQGRDTTDLPDHAGEEVVTDVHDTT
jgi:hypothetical protein